MYNRYIPQPDGSYQRNRMREPEFQPPKQNSTQESCRQEPTPEQARQTQSASSNQGGQPCGNGRPPRRPGPPPKQPPCHNPPPHRDTGVFNFFRQLLPRDFDTEDLLIVLLLLLMSGDCKEDQNTALLTLALYLFL